MMGALKTSVVPVTPFQQNCTLLWDAPSMTGVVIDPGGDVERIADAIAREAIDVQAIWLTHGHLDHAAGAPELQAALNRRPDHAPVPIVGPDRRDEPLLASLRKQGEMFGLPGLANVTPDRWLSEGETLSVGEHAFEILHCPGHTPGHVVFFCRAQRFAQVGDVLFAGSVGRTDFPYGDHAALIDAIRTKLLPLGDDVAFICGHGPGSSIGAERRGNPFIR
jgi:glyoxylase-like metal-dependent hydrolase (beta-lactamase superfamily II)